MDIRGEYWIHEDGWVDFADGDVGDYNHEAIVVNLVQHKIADAMAGVEGPNGEIKNHTETSYDGNIEWDEFTQDLEEVFDGDEDAQLDAIKQAGITDEEWACATTYGVDPREFALKNWGWKSVRGNNVDTWNYTRDDLDTIVSGLDEILEQEGGWDAEDAETEVSIVVFSTGQHFTATLDELKNQLNPQPTKHPAQEYLQQKSRERDQYYGWMTNIAKQQNADQDLEKMHPAYKRKGVNPFGDSVMGFKTWLNEHLA